MDKIYKFVFLVGCGVLLAMSFSSCRVYKQSAIDLRQLVCNDSVPCNPQPGDTVHAIAGHIYEAGKFKRFLLGDHYRDVWTAPVEVPVIDMAEKKGGLTPIEVGGGMQTRSLKLKGADGRLYTFRSLQKDPTRILPAYLKGTVAGNVIQDQISASNPYGAFILPPMEEAAGIYHTNPELVWLPKDSLLGKYKDLFGNSLVMFEEDADESWTNEPSFGRTENAVSTETVLDDLQDDNDNRIDQKEVLKVRLFDMWVNDWDRHSGQWRWAEFDTGKGNFYRPIPEDRDNVFFKFDGVLPWIANREFALRKFQSFGDDIRDIVGLNFNARHFDRRFLNQLNRQEWLAIADTLQQSLPDSIIWNAVKQLPDTVYSLTGPYIAKTLIARKKKLREFARRYYDALAEQVEVVGSDKHEFFVVERKEGGKTDVTVYKSNDEGGKEKVIYNREFLPSETKEIRLFARGNHDFFTIEGKAKQGIKVRVIGGDGKDTYVDSSFVKGLARKTKIYDLDSIRERSFPHLGPESQDLRTRLGGIYRYQYRDFQYSSYLPLILAGFTADDGVFVGGGVSWETQGGFRKEPYATSQQIRGRFASRSQDFFLNYEGDFIKVFGPFGFHAEIDIKAPRNETNFFGLGNETEVDDPDDDFFDYEYDKAVIDPGLTVNLEEEIQFKFGPYYEFADVRKEENLFITRNEAEIDEGAFEANHFGGFKFGFTISTLEEIPFPREGFKLTGDASYNFGLFGEENRFSRLQSEMSLFHTFFPKNSLILGTRMGASTIIGDFYFYQASTLGGSGGPLRGFRRDRFSGRTSFFQNVDAKVKLATFDFYFFPFKMGITGYGDYGRVWIDGEDSDRWHWDYGGGVWITPFNSLTMALTFTKSDDDGLWFINLGFTDMHF